MSAKLLVEWISIAESVLCFIVLFSIWKKKAMSDFKILAGFIALRALYGVLTVPVLFFRKEFGMSKLFAYNVFFFTSWISVVLQAVLMVAIVSSIYNLCLDPLEPLRKLGRMMFRWVAAVSVMVSLGIAVGPHMFGPLFFANLISQIQQTANILTLCLLLFVCFAMRPLGLTPRSRPFGVCLGLGILATTQLVQSAWLPTAWVAGSVYSIVYFYGGLGACLSLSVWAFYFVAPEPERRMVLLPTTSPYFFWNKISEALGDAPGYVAVSGFTPDSLAPDELSAMLAVSRHTEDAAPRVLQPIAVNR